jgi:hypothetical protein
VGRAELLAHLRTAGIGAWTAESPKPLSTLETSVVGSDSPLAEGADDALNLAVQAVVGADASKTGLSSQLHRSLIADGHARLNGLAVA